MVGSELEIVLVQVEQSLEPVNDAPNRPLYIFTTRTCMTYMMVIESSYFGGFILPLRFREGIYER